MAQAYPVRTSNPHKSQWKPLRRMRTHELVVAQIEGRLVAGTLKAGDRLPPERQFAEALGVSRSAVREALRILEAIGVVEAGAGSGPASGSTIVKDGVAGMSMVLRIHMQVASFTHDDLVDVRQLIEQLVAQRAVECATAEDISELRRLIAEMREHHRPEAYRELETAFHERIAQTSGNGLAAVLMAALRSAHEHATGDPVDKRAAVDEYAAVVDAIAAGNVDRAAELAAIHVADSGRAVASKKQLRQAG